GLASGFLDLDLAPFQGHELAFALGNFQGAVAQVGTAFIPVLRIGMLVYLTARTSPGDPRFWLGAGSLGVGAMVRLGAVSRITQSGRRLFRTLLAETRGAAKWLGASRAGFSTVENSIINEVRGIPIGQLRAAFEAGGAELSIGGRAIVIEPG